MIYLGCHLSSSKGFYAMGQTALSIGANTFAFFTRNPRGGSVKELDPADAEMLLKMQQSGELGRIVAHAPYTVNPCAKDGRTLEFARQAMQDDLKRMEYLPGNYYNFHPGSHVGQGVDKGIELIAETLNTVMFPQMQTVVLLETMAGKGTEVGFTFSQLRQIIERVELPEKLGVCLDTCHVHDGGYDIVSQTDAVLDEFDREIGLHKLYALHINDSKNPMGAKKDRHACIGRGEIGFDALYALVHHPLLCGRPMILETPNELDGYREEITLLRNGTKS